MPGDHPYYYVSLNNLYDGENLIYVGVQDDEARFSGLPFTTITIQDATLRDLNSRVSRTVPLNRALLLTKDCRLNVELQR